MRVVSKKATLLVALSLAVLLVSATIGTALAQEPVKENPPTPVAKKLFARVAEILGIEEQQLLDAFTQAQKELAAERFQARLDKLVEQGHLTEEQAKQIKEWWEQRPEFLGPGFGLMGPGLNFYKGLRWGKGHFPWAPKPSKKTGTIPLKKDKGGNRPQDWSCFLKSSSNL